MRRGIYQDGYFKVSRRILESSLWCESGDVMKVFLSLVALSQDPASPRDGTVFIDPRQLAAKCFMPMDQLQRCLAVLAGPDERSRTQIEDGRRIEVLQNGYRVLNYSLYHDRDKDEKVSRARARAGRVGGMRSAEVRRNQQDGSKQTGKQTSSKTPIGKQEGNETETGRERETTPGRSEPAFVREVFHHWREVMGKAGTTLLDDKRRSKIQARLREGYTVDDCRRAIEGNKASAWHQGDNPDGKKYNELSLILRSGSDLERFRDMAPRRQPAPVVLSDEPPTPEAVNEWVEVRAEMERSIGVEHVARTLLAGAWGHRHEGGKLVVRINGLQAHSLLNHPKLSEFWSRVKLEPAA